MEIILPADMTVRESHDIALVLQHKIEKLADVERAFVHVDHNKRDGLEHKVERKLISGTCHCMHLTVDDSVFISHYVGSEHITDKEFEYVSASMPLMMASSVEV
jgi:hypothetical protein